MAENQESSNVEINMTDIKNMNEIIKVCTKRGSFLQEELEGVGSLYKKLTLFIEHNYNKVEEKVEEKG
jgi:hypothetical protein